MKEQEKTSFLPFLFPQKTTKGNGVEIELMTLVTRTQC